MNVITHYVGNRAPSLFYTLKVPTAADPTTEEPFPLPPGATVKLYVRLAGSTTFLVDGAAMVILNDAAVLPTDVDAGKVRYDWTAPDVVGPPNEFVAWIRVTFTGGATQDTPEFIWDLRDHSSVAFGAGLYTSPGGLKDFTGLDELKGASDEFLAENVIPRAEAWLQAWGPYISVTCPALKLAANMLAEYIWIKVNPRTRNLLSASGFKSESIGNYSYTLNDITRAGQGSESAWDDLMNEIGMIVSSCVDPRNMAPLFSSDHIFEPLRGFEIDPVTGGYNWSFEVREEILTIHRRWVNGFNDSWGTWS